MTIEEAINLLDNLVKRQTGEQLTRLQQSIIRGVLQGLTYKEIKENDPVAYLAEDENLPDRPFCLVKRLKSQSEKTSRMFDVESRVLYRLGQHDSIPELLARFEEDGYFYLVYEFIEGKPLDQELIEGQPWEEDRVIALLKDILEVLAFVHKKI